MRPILAAVVGSIVLMFWGFLSWAALGLHETSGGTLPDEGAFVQTMSGMGAEDGVYFVPMMPSPDDLDPAAYDAEMEAWATRHEDGPLALVVYHPGGQEPMAPKLFVIGLMIGFISCFVGALLLSAARLRTYLGRVAFMTTLGLLIAVGADLSYWNWLRFPTDYTIVNMLDHVVGWFLAGLLIAAIVRPRSTVAD